VTSLLVAPLLYNDSNSYGFLIFDTQKPLDMNLIIVEAHQDTSALLLFQHMVSSCPVDRTTGALL